MSNQETDVPKRKKRKKRKNNTLKYLILFTAVFSVTLFAISYFVDLLTPDADVAIGNSEPITLSGSDMSIEEKTIDERLRWIQEEDELPSLGVNEPQLYKPQDLAEQKEIEKEPKEIKKVIEKPKKINYDEVIADNKTLETKPIKKEQNQKIDFIKADFRKAAETSGVVPKPIKPVNSISKVFIGHFSTVEEAVEAQNNIVRENLDVIPFVKAVSNYYVVQIGSFSDKDKAEALADKFKSRGYSSRVISDN